MKRSRVFVFVLIAFALKSEWHSQSYQIVPHNKIALTPAVNIERRNNIFEYAIVLTNGVSAQQAVWRFDMIVNCADSLKAVTAPANWEYHVFPVHGTLEWTAIPMDTVEGYIAPIRVGQSLTGFSFSTAASPGIVTYYAEGDGPIPYFDEGQATDRVIPGYDDLTPYGPGIVGKTVGPVEPPDLSVMTSILDTLTSYKHQCLTLGWLRDDNAHKQDCDDMMKGRDWYKRGEFEKFRNWEPDESWEFDHDWNSGIVRVLDRRLDKAKRELTGGDSVRARKDLEIFVMEVEMLNNLSKKLEGREQKKEFRDQKPIMTSEAYALLKYNAEYLIDRLPERHGKVDERRGKK